MLAKKINYTDYDGNPRTEECLFFLSKSDLLEMDMSTTGGMEKLLRKIINTQDTPKLYAIIKDIVMKSYGVKSDDGRRFIKNKTLSEEFSQTEAFSELIVELFSDPDKLAEFIRGILPQDIASQLPSDTEVAKMLNE